MRQRGRSCATLSDSQDARTDRLGDDSSRSPPRSHSSSCSRPLRRPALTRDSWPQVNHDASGNRANVNATQISLANVDQVGWVRGLAGPPPGEGECGREFTAPLVVGKRPFAVSNGRLLAYNVATGRQIWERVIATGHLTNVIRVAAVAGGRIFTRWGDCTSGSDPARSVRAYDAADGAPLWLRGVSGLNGVSVTRGRVIAAGDSAGSGLTVRVLDPATGATIWEASGECGDPGAVVAHNRVFYQDCDADPHLVAAAVRTGAVAWEKPGFWDVQRADAAGTDASHLYVGHDTVLDPATGETRFGLTGSSRIDAVDATRVYASCGGVVCAFARDTGARAWTSDVPAGSFQSARLALAGALLYSSRGTVLDAVSGATVGQL